MPETTNNRPSVDGEARCPKCGSERIGILWSSNEGCTNMVECPDCKAQWHCSGLLELAKFFPRKPESAPTPGVDIAELSPVLAYLRGLDDARAQAKYSAAGVPLGAEGVDVPSVDDLARMAWEKRQPMFKSYDSWEEVGGADKQVYLEAAMRYREIFQELLRKHIALPAAPDKRPEICPTCGTPKKYFENQAAAPPDCQYGRPCKIHGVIHDNTGDANNNIKPEAGAVPSSVQPNPAEISRKLYAKHKNTNRPEPTPDEAIVFTLCEVYGRGTVAQGALCLRCQSQECPHEKCPKCDGPCRKCKAVARGAREVLKELLEWDSRYPRGRNLIVQYGDVQRSEQELDAICDKAKAVFEAPPSAGPSGDAK